MDPFCRSPAGRLADEDLDAEEVPPSVLKEGLIDQNGQWCVFPLPAGGLGRPYQPGLLRRDEGFAMAHPRIELTVVQPVPSASNSYSGAFLVNGLNVYDG
jgi:hypothetical protein